MDYLINFLDFIQPYGKLGLLVIFIVLIACGFGLPLPEDIPLISSGIMSGRDIVSFWSANLVGFSGVLIGDGIIFSLGYFKGQKIKKFWFFKRLFTPERDVKIKQWFAKYGSYIVFFARFMPGLRMPIFLSTGIFHIPFWKFFLLDGFAALISVPVWIYLGHKFGENLEYLFKMAHNFQMGLFISLGVVIVLIVGAYLVKKKLKTYQ